MRESNLRQLYCSGGCKGQCEGYGCTHSIDETAFALVADGEDVDTVFCRQEAIHRHVTGTSFRNDEFAQVVRGRASDQGVALQYRGGIDDLFTGRDGEVQCFLFEKLGYTFERAEEG